MEFALSRKIPVPDETREADRFTISAPPEPIMAFWKKQLDRLDTMIAQATAQEQWQKRTPGSIGRVTGELKTVTIAQLIKHYNVGGRNWVRRFFFGFPLIGILSQKGVLPKGGRVGHQTNATATNLGQIASSFHRKICSFRIVKCPTTLGRSAVTVGRWLAGRPNPHS